MIFGQCNSPPKCRRYFLIQNNTIFGFGPGPKSGLSLGISRELRKILRSERMYNPFSPNDRQGSIDFNTVNTTCPIGMYFQIHPQGWIQSVMLPNILNDADTGTVLVLNFSDTGSESFFRYKILQILVPRLFFPPKRFLALPY